MADRPFDRTNFGIRERPLSGDFNQQSSQTAATITELARMMLSPRGAGLSSAMASATCLIGDSLRIGPTSPAGMNVVVAAGHGFIYSPADVPTDIGAPDLENVDDISPFKPVFLASPMTFAVPAAPGPGLGRTDMIEIKVDRRNENSTTRRQLDVGSTSFVNKLFNKTLAFALDGRSGIVAAGGGNSTAGISYKIGTAVALSAGNRRDGNAVPPPPSVSPGYVKLGDIQVITGATSITTADLNDRRKIAGFGGVVDFAAHWAVNWNGGAPLVTTKAMSAPPGIQIGLNISSVTRANGSIVIVGGEIAQASASVTMLFLNNVIGAGGVTTGGAVSADLGPATTPGTFDSWMVPVVIGAESKQVVINFGGQFISPTVVNRTDTALEVFEINLRGTLMY